MAKSWIALACAAFAVTAPAVDAAELTGLWARGDGKAQVKVERCGDSFCATNVWVRPGTAHERVGDQLIMDVAPVEPGRYEGEAEDVRRGMTYSMTITLGDNAMRTRGCVLGQLLCKSARWTSVQ